MKELDINTLIIIWNLWIAVIIILISVKQYWLILISISILVFNQGMFKETLK